MNKNDLVVYVDFKIPMAISESDEYDLNEILDNLLKRATELVKSDKLDSEHKSIEERFCIDDHGAGFWLEFEYWNEKPANYGVMGDSDTLNSIKSKKAIVIKDAIHSQNKDILITPLGFLEKK